MKIKTFGSQKRKDKIAQTILTVIAVILVFLAFIPIFLMMILSLKSTAQIYGNFWALPNPVVFSNYGTALQQLMANMINSIILVGVSTICVVILSSLVGYVFARLEFAGKNFLYLIIIALMMVPAILTLTPRYTLMQDLHLTNTWWALILPWVSGGQVFGIMLCRSFLESQPAALFESARLDGCSEIKAYFYIAIPLAKPVLATLSMMTMIGEYNDFIWPLMVIENNNRQVITVAIRVYQANVNGGTNIGVMVAGCVIATLPLLLLFLSSSQLFMEGLTAGAIKE